MPYPQPSMGGASFAEVLKRLIEGGSPGSPTMMGAQPQQTGLPPAQGYMVPPSPYLNSPNVSDGSAPSYPTMNPSMTGQQKPLQPVSAKPKRPPQYGGAFGSGFSSGGTY